MKQQYTSPEMEILMFLPAERLAYDIRLQNEETAPEVVPDVTFDGNKIPGW